MKAKFSLAKAYYSELENKILNLHPIYPFPRPLLNPEDETLPHPHNTPYHVPVSILHLEECTKLASKSVSVGLLGGLMDIGAQSSCIGIAQAKEYCQAAGIDFKLTPSLQRFCSGEGMARSIGRLPIAVPTPTDIITIWVDVVHSNIPLLIGLDSLDKYGLQVVSVTNEVESVHQQWRIRPQRKHGHIYWEWPMALKIFFTKPQLERVQRHMLHPSSKKLYTLLRRAKPEDLNSDTYSILQEIQKSCETCQLYAPKQFVF